MHQIRESYSRIGIPYIFGTGGKSVYAKLWLVMTAVKVGRHRMEWAIQSLQGSIVTLRITSDRSSRRSTAAAATRSKLPTRAMVFRHPALFYGESVPHSLAPALPGPNR